MKFMLLLSVFLGFLHWSQAQECMTIEEYEERGKKIAVLDSLYPSAMHIDTSIAVFHGREKQFRTAWVSLLQDLAKYLAAHDFVWGEATRCFNRVYFDESGNVNTFLFKFRKDQVSPEKQARFAELLSDFIADYRLRIEEPAVSRFSQCGPVVYSDM